MMQKTTGTKLEQTPNLPLVADTQRRNAAARPMLRAVQL
jgi:hypothetical protein